MKKLMLLASIVLLGTGCATKKEMPMYDWGTYSQDYYLYLKQNTPESQEKLIATLNSILTNQSKTIRQVPPPGACADLGYLLVQQGKVDEGILLMAKEVEYYPESAQFINSMVKRIKEN